MDVAAAPPQAFILIIPTKDGDIDYDLNLSIGENGDPHNSPTLTMPFPGLLYAGGIKDQLTEIDVSTVFTGVSLNPGSTYVSLNFDTAGLGRQVVGWSTSARLQGDLVLEALRMALGRRTLSPDLIHHSNRGSQYASHEFQNLLRDKGMECSMSGAGNCYDNAVAESFFATLKRERVYWVQYQTRAEATTDLFQYI
jgi:transposase InsO family protein